MNFLGPLYLWLLPLISIPLIIYLLNRKKTKTIYYSTLRFFNIISNEAIKRFNIINNLLLLIRTLIILFFILMLTRPVISSNTSNNTGLSSIYLLIDNSYTMHDILNENINIYINKISQLFHESSDLKIILLDESQEIIYNNKLKDFNKNSLKINTSLLNSTFNGLSDILNDDININKYAFIITDGQEYLIKDIAKTKIFNDINTKLLTTTNTTKNLAITNVEVYNDIVLPNQIFQLSVLIDNNGNVDINNAQFDLYINDIKVGQKNIDIKKGDNTEILYDINLPSYGEHLCKITYSGNDDINLDNNFYLRFFIDESLEIDIVDDSNNLFIDTILNSYNIENKIVHINNFTLNEYIDTYNKNNIIIINGFNNINSKLINQLTTNNYQDYRIIAFPSMNDISYDRIISLFGSKIKQESKRKSTDISTFFELDMLNIKDLNINSIFSNRDNRNIKIFNYLSSVENKNTLIKLNNDDFLLNRYKYKNLDLYLFSISMDLESSNFPLKASSIAIFKKLITKNKFINFYNIDFPVKMMKIEKDINLISPTNNIFLNNRNLSNSATFNELGFYKIDINTNNPKHIPINLSSLELSSPILDINEINQIINKSIYSTNSIDDLINNVRKTNYNYDIWKILLYIILLLISMEMYLCTKIKNND